MSVYPSQIFNFLIWTWKFVIYFESTFKKHLKLFKYFILKTPQQITVKSGKEFVILEAKPQDMKALSIDYVIKI